MVCVDEALRYAVPVLGGHGGGGQRAGRTGRPGPGGRAGHHDGERRGRRCALDEFGADLDFTLEPGSDLAAVGTAILLRRAGHLSPVETEWPLPPLPLNAVAH